MTLSFRFLYGISNALERALFLCVCIVENEFNERNRGIEYNSFSIRLKFDSFIHSIFLFALQHRQTSTIVRLLRAACTEFPICRICQRYPDNNVNRRDDSAKITSIRDSRHGVLRVIVRRSKKGAAHHPLRHRNKRRPPGQRGNPH